MKKNTNTIATWKNTLLTLAFISFSVFSVSALADTGSRLETSKDPMAATDTIQMTAGVPLKPEDVSPLLAGEQIPVLSMPKFSGEMFDLNKSIAETPTILVFYRGGWCPYCSKQLAGLQEIEKDLTQMGYQVIAISTDSPENLRKTMNDQKLSYVLLSDADLNAAKHFGVAYKGPKSYNKFLPETSGGKNIDKLLPVPSVFILKFSGKSCIG